MNKIDFNRNIGGLNTSDSPFYVQDDQATAGYNYEYLKTGGLTKRRGHQKLNSVADADTRTLGMGVRSTSTNTHTALRAAGTHIKTVDITTGTNTNITEDTLAVNSAFFTAGSTQPVVFSNFNTGTADVAWFAGGGATKLYGYNGTKVTQNGVPAPTGTFSGVVGGTGGTFITTGTYYYALVLRKASTQALSNAALDFAAVITATTEKVTITLPTGVDTTKYDQFYIYRSAVGGVTEFTTGVLVAQVATSSTTYIDSGTALTVTDNVPRPAYPILDNSVLPTGTFKSVVTWKNQLITCTGNTIYMSEILKSESWPVNKSVTVVGAGEITALGVINFNSRSTASMDEYLVIWTSRKMYIIQGTGLYDVDLGIWDVTLIHVDAVGCIGQSTVVNAYGNILWMDVSGVYSWDANGKPACISRLVESLYSTDGDYNRALAGITFGVFFRKQKQVHWFFPHRTEGENKISLMLDGRLTYMSIGSGDEEGTVTDAGKFLMHKAPVSIYGGCSILTTDNDEYLLLGDDNGFVYNALRLGVDQVPVSVDATGDSGIQFDYYTRWFDMGSSGVAKRFNKVIVYVEAMTPDNLTLQYWTDYRVRDATMSQIDQNMGVKGDNAASLWDVAFWDSSLWDDYQPNIKALTFNLQSGRNNSEGDAIRLRFKQFDESVPVVILGFSIIHSDMSVRK